MNPRLTESSEWVGDAEVQREKLHQRALAEEAA